LSEPVGLRDLMGCNCGRRPKYVVNPRRGVTGSWSVIYPHGAVRPFSTETEARSFVVGRDNYTLVDPDGNVA
jgi:hypothetical protein